MSELDTRVAELAARCRPLAATILREVIRIPADYVDRPKDAGGDPSCGLSNHEKPRLEYLKRMIVEIGAVRRPEDVGYDGYGNLVWTVEDPADGIPPKDKRVVYFDGHTDTVNALRPAWKEKTGGVDAYDGLFDPARVKRDFLKRELGYLPPESEWDNLVFGRGSADQLSGVVAQVVASKILLELAPLRLAARRHRPLVRDRDRRGQRRRRTAVPHEEGPARRRAGARPGRGHPHGGHGRLREGGSRDLPRPARPHADPGERDRESPATDRCRGKGRTRWSGARPSSSRRRSATTRETVSSTTRSSGTARARPRGPASTRRATARSPSASSSASTGVSRSERRPRRRWPTSRVFPPWPPRGRRG